MCFYVFYECDDGGGGHDVCECGGDGGDCCDCSLAAEANETWTFVMEAAYPFVLSWVVVSSFVAAAAGQIGYQFGCLGVSFPHKSSHYLMMNLTKSSTTRTSMIVAIGVHFVAVAFAVA